MFNFFYKSSFCFEDELGLKYSKRGIDQVISWLMRQLLSRIGSVADLDLDPVRSGFLGHPDSDPRKNWIRILYPQKDPVNSNFLVL